MSIRLHEKRAALIDRAAPFSIALRVTRYAPRPALASLYPVLEADEDEARGVRASGDAVLIGDVCRARDGDSRARLANDELCDIRRGEAAGTRSFEGHVTGG